MSKNNWITKINYKDIIIIYILWFSTILFTKYFNFTSFMQISDLGGFFDILFFFAARLIFISLIFLYFVFLSTSFYGFSNTSISAISNLSVSSNSCSRAILFWVTSVSLYFLSLYSALPNNLTFK